MHQQKQHILENLMWMQAKMPSTNLFCGGCDEHNCQGNIDYIASQKAAGNFNLTKQPILNNPFGIYDIDKYVSISSTDYKFPGRFLANKVMKAMVLLPDSPSIKGVILYFHPTTFGKGNCPTNFGPEYQPIRGLLASQDYAVVFPNKIGFQKDQLIHPHVQFPQANARTGVSVMNSSVTDKIWARYKNLTSLELLYWVTPKALPTACGWRSACSSQIIFQTLPILLTNQAIKLCLIPFISTKKTVGMDGAYDITEVVYPFLMSNVGYFLDFNNYRILYQAQTNYAKSGLAALVVMGY